MIVYTVGVNPFRLIQVISLSIMIGMAPLCYSASQPLSLDEIKQVADTGAVGLATRLLEQQQPHTLSKPDEWMQWETQRLQFYIDNKNWPKVIERTDQLPAFVSAEFIQWALTRRAEAQIAAQQGAAARTTLRRLIWQSLPEDTDEKKFYQWRQLIIQSYLADGLADDAQTASIKLAQDYDSSAQDKILQAHIALLNDRTSDAISLLKPLAEQPQAAALQLLAQLRGQHRSSKHVLQAALRYLRENKLAKEDRANLWAVAAEAAHHSGKQASTANAMEHVLVMQKDMTLPDSIISLGNEQLWNAYVEYALYISNKEQLLVGQDQRWMEVASQIQSKRPVGARAMHAFLMLRAQSDDVKNRAAQQFVRLVTKRRHGKQLLQALFEPSRYFKSTASIPEPVRHELVDIALAQSNIDRASEVMASIEKPPKGSDQFMWQLRRARILVLGNQPKVGAQAVQDILTANKQLEQIQIDRLLQVVFDLQVAGEHEQAYQLFEKTINHTSDDKIQRELLFWMADSRKAQERYLDAARLYLKSAAHPDPKNMDPWAQTARYHAAESLERAGLYADAESIFSHLLRVTDDPNRRARLKSELQKLWAMQ